MVVTIVHSSRGHGYGSVCVTGGDTAYGVPNKAYIRSDSD